MFRSLIIDDDVQTLNMLRQMLEHYDYEVMDAPIINCFTARDKISR